MLFLIYLLSAVSIAGSLAVLFADYAGTPLEILAYILFAFAGTGLAYTVYTFVIYAPGFKRAFVSYIDRRPFGQRILSDWGFRTVITAAISFSMSVANAVIHAIAGIGSRSVWYGALASYYILISMMRGGLLLGGRRKSDNRELRNAGKYRNCGIILFVLNIALSSFIAQMILDGRSFIYRDWLIYAFAAYAFYKVIMAVFNVFKARRLDDLAIQGIRNINLVDGAVSILSLQTALLNTFAEDGSVNISLFNTLTGSLVSLFTMSLSIYMIVKGNKAIRKIKNGK